MYNEKQTTPKNTAPMKNSFDPSCLLKPRFIITLLLLLIIYGIICRYLYVLDVASRPFFDIDLSKTDVFIYDLKAKNTLREDPLDLKMATYPIFIQFMSFIYRSFGTDPLAFYTVQYLLSMISVFLLAWTGALLFGTIPGLISGVLLLFYKMNYVYDAIKLHTALSQFLLITALFFFVINLYKPSWRYYLGYLVYGILLCLLRIFFWILFIPGAIYGFIKNKYWKRPFYIFIFFIFIIASFLLYNYFKTTDPYGQKFGIHFLIGNNAYANGLLMVPIGICPNSESFAKAPVLLAHQQTGSIKNITKFWILKTFESYKNKKNPVLTYLKLLGRKINILVNNMEYHNNINVYYMEKKTILKDLPRLDYIVILSFTLVGILYSLRHKKSASFLLVPMGVITLMILSIFLCARYRMPLIPFLCLFAGYGITNFAKNLKGRQYFRIGLVLIIISFSFRWAHIKLPYFDLNEQMEIWKDRERLKNSFIKERQESLAILKDWDHLSPERAVLLTDRLGRLNLFYEFFNVYDKAFTLAGKNNVFRLLLLKRKAKVYEEMFNFHKAKKVWEILREYPGYATMANKKIKQLSVLESVLGPPP